MEFNNGRVNPPQKRHKMHKGCVTLLCGLTIVLEQCKGILLLYINSFM